MGNERGNGITLCQRAVPDIWQTLVVTTLKCSFLSCEASDGGCRELITSATKPKSSKPCGLLTQPWSQISGLCSTIADEGLQRGAARAKLVLPSVVLGNGENAASPFHSCSGNFDHITRASSADGVWPVFTELGLFKFTFKQLPFLFELKAECSTFLILIASLWRHPELLSPFLLEVFLLYNYFLYNKDKAALFV